MTDFESVAHFDARIAGRNPYDFTKYLELVTAYASGDQEAWSMRFMSSTGRIASAIVKAANLDEADPQIPEQALSDAQIAQAVDTLTNTDDAFVAARGLATFVESAGSEFALERAFQRYQDIPDTRNFWETRWGLCTIEEASPYIKTSYLGRDIGMAFAKLGLHEQASSATRWVAEHHNEQMAVNITAYTLNDTSYPDTIRWCMEEFLHTISEYSHCNTEFFADNLKEKHAKFEAYGFTEADRDLIQVTLQSIEAYQQRRAESD